VIEINKEQPISNGLCIVMNINRIKDEKEQEAVRYAVDLAHAGGDAVVFLSEAIDRLPDWIESIEGMDRFIPSSRIGIHKLEFPDLGFMQIIYGKILGEGLLLTSRRTKLTGVCLVSGKREFFKGTEFYALNIQKKD
jgi:hypothetical protein